MAIDALSVMRTNTESEVNLPSTDTTYVSTTEELKDINDAYQKVAYMFDWPTLLKRGATIIVANVNKYGLPSDFRKFRYLKVLDVEKDFVEFDKFSYSRGTYSVDMDFTFSTRQMWIADLPTTASVAYSLTNNESAGNAVVIELDTVSGLGVGDEIFINGTTPEFTTVSSTDSSATTITARLVVATGASKILYKVSEVISYQYYRTVTLLSGASDTTVLPDATDSIIPVYAAFLYFERKKQHDRAKAKLEKFKDMIDTAFSGSDKLTTGEATGFSIG